MQYKVVGLMSGSSLDGLDIAFARFEETAGIWQFEILETACIPYDDSWKKKLGLLTTLSAKDYLLLHSAYGHYLGERVNEFIQDKGISYQVQLIASHGHTAFHLPEFRMTAQLGDGSAIAAVTGIRTISDLRSADIALGGQGAPVVPIGEKLLFPDFDLFLNIGGIANISANRNEFIGFDICPANRILNMLATDMPKGYDEDGKGAASGQPDEVLLKKLNALPYYQRLFPKSLSNDFGLHEVFPLLENARLSVNDALNTYTQHIASQISNSVLSLKKQFGEKEQLRLLITGGGAHNEFLIKEIRSRLNTSGVECIIPDSRLVDYKEALIIALMGVLRWREDVNVMQSVTGAVKDSINGAVWSV